LGDAAAMKLPALTARRGVAALSVTQIVSWGSSYFVPAVLSRQIAADLDIPVAAVFSGITVMLVVGSTIGPALGRRTDRIGPRDILVAGSVLLALGLAFMGLATGLASYALAWALIGLSMPMVLTQTVFAAVAQLMPHASRRALGWLTLLGGLCPPIALPLLAAMEPALGWRGVCFALAVAQILICVPLHAALRVDPRNLTGGEGEAAEGDRGLTDPARRRRAFLIVGAAFACTGFVSWGLPVQMVAIGEALGMELGLAVWIAAMMGPAQMVSRGLETAFGQRVPILEVGLYSAAIIGVACALPAIFGGGAFVYALCVIGYGIGTGAMTIVRVVLPLAIFGRRGYAEIMGKLNLPLNLVFATSPFALSASLTHFGPIATLAICAALSAICVAGLYRLKKSV
jgi:predicted MFS family arabinose efflux permease